MTKLMNDTESLEEKVDVLIQAQTGTTLSLMHVIELLDRLLIEKDGLRNEFEARADRPH